MNEDYQARIISNFVILMNECNVELLKDHLISREVFTKDELDGILYGTHDKVHNKRRFFFRIQKKSNGWVPFVDALRKTKQDHIANVLTSKGPEVFNKMIQDDNDQETLALDTRQNLSIKDSSDPLDIKVEYSNKFYDTQSYNKDIQFYSSRSKKRGRVLIINNYEFNNPELLYRNGAKVDNENLIKLFNQMGGWDITTFVNQTALQMDIQIKNFAHDKNNISYDVCFLIIMSHGNERNRDTVIYGVDKDIINNVLYVSTIQRLFSNDNCTSWRSKPKVFLFSVCRGIQLQTPIPVPISQRSRTETDSAMRSSSTAQILNLRIEEDMLIGYSTVLGYKAIRDYDRGSWYIELLCEVFMNHAHHHPVENLLRIVDQGLRERMTHKHEMQTSEYRNYGFKRLYLHPGIYSENGKTLSYF